MLLLWPAILHTVQYNHWWKKLLLCNVSILTYFSLKLSVNNGIRSVTFWMMSKTLTKILCVLPGYSSRRLCYSCWNGASNSEGTPHWCRHKRDRYSGNIPLRKLVNTLYKSCFMLSTFCLCLVELHQCHGIGDDSGKV